ncbi:MAG: N-acetyltransferase [Proteobacteria bacterium]|nr:N-acetyltransferase [Pseudomonadota bacterium]
MSLTIRPETPDDAPAIATLTAAAFRTAPHTSHTEHFIVAALRRAGALHVSLVATEAGVVVGHVAISPVSISGGASGWFGLGPVSVLPDRQRRGIGSRLLEQALLELRAGGAAGCVVLGEPAFYGRFGFRADSGLVLPGVPAEYFLAVSFAGPRPRGTVAYHAAFEARD